MKHTRHHLARLLGLAFLACQPVSAADLPDPDGKPADVTKPVQVFILLGQSNMVGMAPITGTKGTPLEKAVKEEKLYPFLIDDAGNWTERQDVRNVFVAPAKTGGKGNKKRPPKLPILHNEWLKVGAGFGKGLNKMGVEYGFGHKIGNAIQEPVMILKSCIGNRSLGWDLLPPGSEGFEFKGTDKTTGNEVVWQYAAYKQSPMRWIKGTEPQPMGWYAGKQYDEDTANAKKILAEPETYYPGAKGYEVVGFLWWQGEKDAGDEGLASRYETNLVHLIKTLRQEFNAPHAKFVIGTMGEATKGMTGNTGKVLDAHLAVDGEAGKYPEFKGNVATVYTHPMARGGSGNGHYQGDSRVYMDVGLAMGDAMLKLLVK